MLTVMAQIVLDHVEKAYPGGVQAIDDLSLDIRHGEFMVLVGPSGCGKSTALRSIAGLEFASRGSETTLAAGPRSEEISHRVIADRQWHSVGW
jgi:ABC-type Fe3+/spermidine/putrescine transport system ATPase subunit